MTKPAYVTSAQSGYNYKLIVDHDRAPAYFVLSGTEFCWFRAAQTIANAINDAVKRGVPYSMKKGDVR